MVQLSRLSINNDVTAPSVSTDNITITVIVEFVSVKGHSVLLRFYFMLCEPLEAVGVKLCQSRHFNVFVIKPTSSINRCWCQKTRGLDLSCASDYWQNVFSFCHRARV